MDRLQTMAVFVAVVERGGFASAARELGMSPPVVTRAVAELEARLGVRLLTRTTRVVRVTDAGARYADDCRRILADVDESEVAAAGTHAAPRGTLSLTAPVLFGQSHVTPILVKYLRAFPDVDAQCLFVDRVVNLDEEGLDVAVRIGELPDSSLQAVRVGRVRVMLVASPAYLDTYGAPRTPADLERHTLVSAAGFAVAPEWSFAEGGAATARRVHARLRTTGNDSAIAAATAGFGIARILGYQVATPLREGTLRVVLAEHEPPTRPIHVVFRDGRRATRKVRAFVDLAIESLRADPALA